jgi:hypothetical protein
MILKSCETDLKYANKRNAYSTEFYKKANSPTTNNARIIISSFLN